MFAAACCFLIVFFFQNVCVQVCREGGPINCRCAKTQSVIRRPNLPGVAYDGYRVMDSLKSMVQHTFIVDDFVLVRTKYMCIINF